MVKSEDALNVVIGHTIGSSVILGKKKSAIGVEDLLCFAS